MIGELDMHQQPSQSSKHEPNVAPVPEQPDVSMPDPDFLETPVDPVDNAETFDDVHVEQPPTELVPHSCSSH